MQIEEKNIARIKSFYRDYSIASSYIEERFSKPLGHVQHYIQLEAINNVINRFDVSKTLEIACGPARLTPGIKTCKLAVAMDSSYPMLRIARHRLNNGKKWLFVQTDAFEPGIRQKFQLVYSFRFIRHFRSSDRIKLYKTISKLLEENGILIFDAVHYEKLTLVRKIENKCTQKIYDKIYNTSKEIRNEMNNSGFEILQIKGIIHHFYLPLDLRKAFTLKALECAIAKNPETLL